MHAAEARLNWGATLVKGVPQMQAVLHSDSARMPPPLEITEAMTTPRRPVMARVIEVNQLRPRPEYRRFEIVWGTPDGHYFKGLVHVIDQSIAIPPRFLITYNPRTVLGRIIRKNANGVRDKIAGELFEYLRVYKNFRATYIQDRKMI
jgi:hypothetical protein